MTKITLTIDLCRVEAEQGMTVLEAAQEAGIYIPTLCHEPALAPYGACRLCIVEIERMKGLPTACSTVAGDGMVVTTSNPLIDRVRRNIVELLLSDHPSDCLTCPENGRCDLQNVAAFVGVRQMRFEGEKRAYAIDDSNPFFERDLERCILCGKCVRVCDEIQGSNAIHYAYRGLRTKISTVMDRGMLESTCESCGQCVAMCPVGALRTKDSLRFGLPTGETVTVCPYCGVGCGLVLETRQNQIIGIRGDLNSPANRGRTCVKGRFAYDYVNHEDRLTTPLIRKDGEFVEASWDEALDLVADTFVEIAQRHGPDALAFLSSAKCTNEENYLVQKLSRGVMGTNNVDHCARL